MSHLLDQAPDGRTAFAAANTHAWHRLGVLTLGAMTARRALEKAHLTGWQVRKRELQTAPILTEDGFLPGQPIPGQYATVRTSPWTGKEEVLGVVGSRYHVIQNEEHTDMLDRLVDVSGAYYETAGALRGGREVFVSMKLPEQIKIGDVDDIDLYITALNSHDGSSPYRVLAAPIRVECANTQAAAIAMARQSFSIRHTSGAASQIAAAREALGLTYRYMEAFQQEAEQMIQQTITDAAFNEIVKDLFPEPEAGSRPSTVTRWKDTMDSLNHLFSDASTNANIRGTRWAAYQSVTEHIDHYAVTSRVPEGMTIHTARAMRALGAPAVAVKERAFDLLKV
jgi:phage/plasmid-like protein (TIGR03299 family)